MIKEFKHTLANSKTGYKFGSIELINELINPVIAKIPIINEKEYFINCFNNFVSIELKKRKLFKHADIVPVYLWSGFLCVSEKFRNLFKDKIRGHWYQTNLKKYFIFILDNSLDTIDKNQTIIKYNESYSNHPFRYDFIENLTFKSEIENEYLFTIPELFGKFLITDKFQNIVIQNNLTGLQFFKDINFRKKDGTEFDPFRRKKYDADGNCLE